MGGLVRALVLNTCEGPGTKHTAVMMPRCWGHPALSLGDPHLGLLSTGNASTSGLLTQLLGIKRIHLTSVSISQDAALSCSKKQIYATIIIRTDT